MTATSTVRFNRNMLSEQSPSLTPKNQRKNQPQQPSLHLHSTTIQTNFFAPQAVANSDYQSAQASKTTKCLTTAVND